MKIQQIEGSCILFTEPAQGFEKQLFVFKPDQFSTVIGHVFSLAGSIL